MVYNGGVGGLEGGVVVYSLQPPWTTLPGFESRPVASPLCGLSGGRLLNTVDIPTVQIK